MIGTRSIARVDGVDWPDPEDALRARTFDALLDRPELDRAYRTARIILLDPAEAEDATHDAALTAWRHFGELRDSARFEAWFGRILVNACRDRLRARRRLPISIETAPVAALGSRWSPDPVDSIATAEVLRAALRRLSPEHREVIALRYQADLTVEEIARRTSTRPGTVKSRLHYALRHLRTSVEAADERSAIR